MVCYIRFPFQFISNSFISLSFVIAVSVLSTSVISYSYFQNLCSICFQFLVISQSVLSESVISISIFVPPDSAISNCYSVISDSYYLIPLYQKDHPRWIRYGILLPVMSLFKISYVSSKRFVKFIQMGPLTVIPLTGTPCNYSDTIYSLNSIALN